MHVPETVIIEVTIDQSRSDARLLGEFLSEHSTSHVDVEDSFTQEISQILDTGEVQALALSRKLSCVVLMDELPVRKVAQRYDIQAVGVLGLLVQGKQVTEMIFYGSSFITDEFGEKVAEADRISETVLVYEFDLDQTAKHRAYWGIFRDRRPEHYKQLMTMDGQ